MYTPEILSYAEDKAWKPGSADGLIEGLSKFPNLSVHRIEVATSRYGVLLDYLGRIRSELGREPTVAVFCAHGIGRSREIAKKLAEEIEEDGLLKLSMFNYDEEYRTIGAGIEESRVQVGLRIDDQGGLVWTGDPPDEPFDVMVLALSRRNEKAGWQKDRKYIAQVARYFETRLPETAQKRPIHLLWLEGTEEDFDIWVPDLALKRPLNSPII